MKLSIIIVSFNTCDILCNCLNSVYDSLNAGKLAGAFEIIVVDNASNDGSPDMIQRDFPAVKLIANPENMLFAKANNQGAEIAVGKYIMLLNSDTIISPGNLEKLVDFLDDSPEEIVCAGPLLLNSDGSPQSFGSYEPNFLSEFMAATRIFRFLPSPLVQRICPGMPTKPSCRRVFWIGGSCMLFRRNIYMELNGLNPKVGFYGEELEIAWRMKRKNLQTWVFPEATVTHLEAASTEILRKAKFKIGKTAYKNNYNCFRLTCGVEKDIKIIKLRLFLRSVAMVIMYFCDRERFKRMHYDYTVKKHLLRYLIAHK